jgi:two-component system response regulator NreC
MASRPPSSVTASTHENTKLLRVLVADDHQMVRQGLKSILLREGFEVVGEACDGHEALKLAETLRPDVAVFDIAMPILNGVDAARALRQVSPGTKTILLTMHREDQYVADALRAGIRGFVLKTEAPSDLVRAIQEVARGGKYLSPGISQTVVKVMAQAGSAKAELRADPLSPREREVLQLVAEGRTTKQIAHLLGLSVKTVESHRSSIMDKLEIHDTAGLVRYAIRRGLITA